MNYRSDIDGLRAIAVIPVVIFHMSPALMPGGYLGVDMFFVISGYLITTQILTHLYEGTFSFRDFWARRIRRIFPAMIAAITATLIAVKCIVMLPAQTSAGEQALSSLLSFANIYYWIHANNYWGEAAETSPLLHTWSLSVEEQFYLFFPALLWILVKFWRRSSTFLIGTLAALSFALFLWGNSKYPGATFYLLPTRIWELGAGSLLASLHVTTTGRDTTWHRMGILGLLMAIAALTMLPTAHFGAPIAVAGTTFIIAAAPGHPSRSVLSNRLLVHIGRLSYSIYLWHWSIIVMADHAGMEREAAATCAALYALIYLCAACSHRWVEATTRHNSRVLPVIIALWFGAILLAYDTGSHQRLHDTSKWSPGVYEVANCHPRAPTLMHGAVTFGNDRIHNEGWTPDAWRRDGIRVGDTSREPDIMVFGDSHGCMWAAPIRVAAQELKLCAAFWTIEGLSPWCDIPPTGNRAGHKMSQTEVRTFDIARIEALRSLQPNLVIIGTRWAKTIIVRDLLDEIASIGSDVILIEDPPILEHGSYNMTQWLANKSVAPHAGEHRFEPCDIDQDAHSRRIVREIASAYTNVYLLPTYDIYGDGNEAWVAEGRNVLYLDDDHLLAHGALKIVPRLRDKIEALLSK